MKTKILFFLPQLVGGGAERVTIHIIRILDKFLFDVHLVVANSDGPAKNYLPSEIILHDLNVAKTLFSIIKLRKLVQMLNPDIFFSSLIRGHIAINIAMIGIKNCPYIILRSPNSPKLLLKHNQISCIENLLLKNAYKKADLVIAQTPEMKDEITKFYKTERNKVYFLVNPLDVKTIDFKLKNCQTPFDNHTINIVAAGRLINQKGFDVLIKSFAKVIEKNSLFRLYIIGEDVVGEKAKLDRIIASLGLEQYIVFLGYQENPYQYFKFANLYVLSSRWEGLPNTVLECLYLETPVVATRCIPYMKELIQEGFNGSLVDVEDVDSLTLAILGYKKIKLKFADTIEHNVRINDFFKSRKIEL